MTFELPILILMISMINIITVIVIYYIVKNAIENFFIAKKAKIMSEIRNMIKSEMNQIKNSKKIDVKSN